MEQDKPGPWIRLERSGLSKKTVLILKDLGLVLLAEVPWYTERSLLAHPNIGRRQITEIKEALAKAGTSFDDPPRPYPYDVLGRYPDDDLTPEQILDKVLFRAVGRRLDRLAELGAMGCASAQNIVGVAYQLGIGRECDPERARRWYEMAAAQGYGLARFNLQLMTGSSWEL